MNENSELVKLVVAVLRGTNANAETMHYIINELNIEDEVRHQLNGGESVLTRIGDLAADDLVSELVDEVASIGDDIISDFDVSVYNRSIEVNDFILDDSEIRSAIRRVVNKHFEIV
jgi:hypothetical protein